AGHCTSPPRDQRPAGELPPSSISEMLALTPALAAIRFRSTPSVLNAALRLTGDGLGVGDGIGLGVVLALGVGVARGVAAARLPTGMNPASPGTRNTMPPTRNSTAPTVAKAATSRIKLAPCGKEPKTNSLGRSTHGNGGRTAATSAAILVPQNGARA